MRILQPLLSLSALVSLCQGFILKPLSQQSASSSSSALFTAVLKKEDDATASSVTISPYDPADAFLVDDDDDDDDAVLYDLDGLPLSKDYLAEKMGVSNAKSYTCDGDAFRGFMSNGCRIKLAPGGETAFYKDVVFSSLPHARRKLKTSPEKLTRDIKSYQVVAAWLNSKACRALCEKTGVGIPQCYDAQLQPNHDNPIDSKFSLLLEDYNPDGGWYQQWLLQDVREVQAALSTFAKIHAFFWSGADFWKDSQEAAKELETAIWPSGGYVQTKFQPNQCQIVAQEWDTKKQKFASVLNDMEYWDDLGERLQSVATQMGRLAFPFGAEDEALANAYQQYRTFTHGDPKQANLFFRHDDDDETNDDNLQLGLIDFQWSGFGLAATDIAHFMSAAVYADQLVDGGEERLLKYYYGELQKYLVEYGAFDAEEAAKEGYSWETFIDQYEIGVLDKCRLVIAYTWARFEEPVERDDEAGKARTMNKTSYNKSIPNVIWLMSKCDEILRSRGV